MIDGLFKSKLDLGWDIVAKPVARVLTANQVTYLGLFFVVAACLAFLWHQSTLIFALTIALSFSADSLDGAVARLRKESSHYGGYLDAMIDRYQELAVLFVIAIYSGQWAAAMASFSGAAITSYAKARVALETPIDNNNWPDLFERQERIIFICALLVATGLGAHGLSFLAGLMGPGLWLFAALCHLTALQRFLRARTLLVKLDQDLKS